MAEGGVPNSGGGLGRGRSIIVVLIISILLLLAYRYYSNKPGSWLAGPVEYQLQYMPADFRMEFDTEEALAILQNPRRYRAEFDEMIYDINLGILDHVSNRLGLNDSLRSEVVQEYARQHSSLADLYFNDFMQVLDTSGTVYDTWYEEGGKRITQVFEEVAANYTCLMVNKILAAVIRTRDGNILASGSDIASPCGIAMGEALSPLMRRMEERAAIDDFSRSRGLFQEKVERVIGELATLEVRDKKGINKNLQTSIWGINVSSTDVEITAISILKVGFRLTDYFDINLDARNQLLTITLPEPAILSHEVLPKIERLDIGWMRELESVNINEGINSLRENFRAEAIEDNVYDRARDQAIELMNTMFTPIVRTIGNNYRIKVDFRDVGPTQPQELVEAQ
ncbi:MAG: DUF4230 domain-containing protein [Bacteroidota bacterium]